MNFENKQQGSNNRDGNNQEGMMEKIGDKIENMVDAVTGNDQDKGSQKGRNGKDSR
jgi:hypothetical protein